MILNAIHCPKCDKYLVVEHPNGHRYARQEEAMALKLKDMLYDSVCYSCYKKTLAEVKKKWQGRSLGRRTDTK